MSPEPLTPNLSFAVFRVHTPFISPEPFNEILDTSLTGISMWMPFPRGSEANIIFGYDKQLTIVVGHLNILQDIFFCFERNDSLASSYEANDHAAVNTNNIVPLNLTNICCYFSVSFNRFVTLCIGKANK